MKRHISTFREGRANIQARLSDTTLVRSLSLFKVSVTRGMCPRDEGLYSKADSFILSPFSSSFNSQSKKHRAPHLLYMIYDMRKGQA